MSKLVFESIINLTESSLNIPPTLVRNLCMVNEPNNELVQYYIHQDRTEDKATNISYNNYTEAKWGDKKRRLTARNVSRIGVKAFPGVGAIAYFKYLYNGRSMIICPVNNNQTQYEAPILEMKVNDDDTITFIIKPTDTISYECYRIILEHDQFAYEYITYELSLTIPKPEVKGHYNIYCIGYENEGEVISFDSNVLELNITTGQESFAPKAEIAYYTKEQVDAMFGQIGDLLDKLNGVVI